MQTSLTNRRVENGETSPQKTMKSLEACTIFRMAQQHHHASRSQHFRAVQKHLKVLDDERSRSPAETHPNRFTWCANLLHCNLSDTTLSVHSRIRLCCNRVHQLNTRQQKRTKYNTGTCVKNVDSNSTPPIQSLFTLPLRNNTHSWPSQSLWPYVL